jgi:peptidoglycan/LPS O-acetylase OafA/YrhL
MVGHAYFCSHILKKHSLRLLFFPHDDKTGHFKSLDGLRGIAVLFVMLSHTSNKGIYFHEYLDFRHTGKLGVFLFFVLSAYLLDRQIVLAFRNGTASRQFWAHYFLRRFLRIYPLFVVALIVYTAPRLWGFGRIIDFSDIPSHLLLLEGKSIFWSIATEFKFYFLSPLLLYVFHHFFKWKPSKILAVLMLLVLSSVISEWVFDLSRTSTLRYLPFFLMGTTIATFEIVHGQSMGRRLPDRFLAFAGTLALMMILLSNQALFDRQWGWEIHFQSSEYFLIYAVLWGLVLLSAKRGARLIKKITELRVLRFFGAISYSLYLFHLLVLLVIQKSPVPDHLHIYAFFILAVLMATVSYLVIERPLSKVTLNQLRSTHPK